MGSDIGLSNWSSQSSEWPKASKCHLQIRSEQNSAWKSTGKLVKSRGCNNHWNKGSQVQSSKCSLQAGDTVSSELLWTQLFCHRKRAINFLSLSWADKQWAGIESRVCLPLRNWSDCLPAKRTGWPLPIDSTSIPPCKSNECEGLRQHSPF